LLSAARNSAARLSFPLPQILTLARIAPKRVLFRQMTAHIEEILHVICDDGEFFADSAKEQLESY
jgi:hypothetical protein